MLKLKQHATFYEHCLNSEHEKIGSLIIDHVIQYKHFSSKKLKITLSDAVISDCEVVMFYFELFTLGM